MNQLIQPNIQPAKSDYERIADLIDQRITRRSGMPLVEFAETCVVTAGPKKGQILTLKDAPYARKPLQKMDPSDPCQLCVLMWASQAMKSVVAQLTTVYYAKEVPSEILYAMSDKEAVRKSMDRRLVPLFEHQGVQFVTSSETKGTKKTGDLALSKEFNGGNIDAVTSNSAAALASETKRLFIADELGQWRLEIANQGNPFYQGWARLKAWLDQKKCLVPSTPGDEINCMQNHLFLEGTREEWLVPCPKCGRHQILTVRHRDGYGLDYRTKRGRIIESSVVYVCMHCSQSFKEKYKYQIQQDGYWEPPEGVEPINQYTSSFHLHSINSMFESWFEIASAFEKGLEDPASKKYYDNHVAGMPSRERGSRVEAAAIMQNRGEYPAQTVPDGVLYLNLGGDVQAGADKWQEYSEPDLQKEIEQARKDGELHEKKFPRIEIEIMGSGPAYRTWSIDYQVFYGHVGNAFDGAFEQLYQYALNIQNKNGGFGFKRESDGMFFPVVLLLLDSGHNSTVVYSFTQRWLHTYPCKGDRMLDAPKGSKNPALQAKNMQLHQSHFIPYKKSQVGPGGSISLYTISTKMYKKNIYNLLNVKRIPGQIQLPNFQDFPREYDKRYFDMLAAEEVLKSGEYDPQGRPNESLDCRVYNMCAADIYLNSQVEDWRAWYKQEYKWNDKQLETINRRWVVEAMAKRMKIDERFLITRKDAA